MDDLYKPNASYVDTRRRRRFYRLIRKIKRISAVILAWLAVGLILYGAYTIIFLRPYFDVETIEVKGNLSALSSDQVIEASGVEKGDHLLRIPVSEIQERLMKNPWIKEAAVHRKFPHMVWIYIKEYVPEAVIRTDGWHYVDRFGKIFKKLDLSDDRDFPVITGLEEMMGREKDKNFRSKLVELMGVKKIYEDSPSGEIYGLSEINFDEMSGVSLMTLNDPMELRLGFGPFMEKIERLQAVYHAIRSHGGVVAYVDLSPEGKVVVKYGT